MANESGIEWLLGDDGSKGLTVNPVIGCSRISPGCGGGYIKGPNGEQGGCWAEDLVSTRMSKNPKLPMYADLARPDGGWSGKVKLVPERLAEIVALGRRKIGKRVFVCDMSDLFHDEVPFAYIAAVFGAMACAPNHLFYVLTKRPARAVEWAKWMASHDVGETIAAADHLATYCPKLHVDNHTKVALSVWPLPNVVVGVTCEDPRYGLPRLPLARAFPARWRFVSVEPLLADLGPDVDFSGFDLVIEGGEAGPNSRPHELTWARNIHGAARRAGARFFMKQAGDFVLDRGVRQLSIGKKGNDLARLPIDLRIRENIPMPEAAR
jgi:protein gp37